MALIYCPECKNSISETANICPKCGYQLSPGQATEIKNEIKKKQLEAQKGCGIGCLSVILIFFVLYLIGHYSSSNSPISPQYPDISSPTKPPENNTADKSIKQPTSSPKKTKLTRPEIITALNNMKIELLTYDLTEDPDYLRVKITNNSSVTLPFLTVKVNRYDDLGENSWAPYSIPISELKPGQSKEYDFHPPGHLSWIACNGCIKKVTVEILKNVDEQDVHFYNEVNPNEDTWSAERTKSYDTVNELDLGDFKFVVGNKYLGDKILSVIDSHFPGDAVFSPEQSITFFSKGRKYTIWAEKVNFTGPAYYRINSITVY